MVRPGRPPPLLRVRNDVTPVPRQISAMHVFNPKLNTNFGVAAAHLWSNWQIGFAIRHWHTGSVACRVLREKILPQNMTKYTSKAY